MNIYQKIAAVMSDVRYLQKDDNVDTGKGKGYKAITEEKVTTVVREAMIKYGLVMFPSSMVTSVTNETVATQYGDKINRFVHVDVTYKMFNIEDPEDYVEIASAGSGVDTQDKGVGKAMTYAYKYALLRTFAIPTGEDADAISSEKYTEKLMGTKPSKTDLEKARNMLLGLGRVKANADNSDESIAAADERTKKFAEKSIGKPFDDLNADELADVKVRLAKK